ASRPSGAKTSEFTDRLFAMLLQSEVPFDALEVAAHFRQLFQRHEDALLFALRRGRAAEHALALRHVARHAGLGADDGPRADVDVVRDADLAGTHHVIARAAGAGDAHLADEQVVLADLAVVADLHEVVDLGAGADARGLERAAVNRRAGPDLGVIA